MDPAGSQKLGTDLHRRAVEKFGEERAATLQNDLQQMARELEALETYRLDFEDEP
jgi:hypothetical protein